MAASCESLRLSTSHPRHRHPCILWGGEDKRGGESGC